MNTYLALALIWLALLAGFILLISGFGRHNIALRPDPEFSPPLLSGPDADDRQTPVNASGQAADGLSPGSAAFASRNLSNAGRLLQEFGR